MGTESPVKEQRIIPQKYFVDEIVDRSVDNGTTLFQVRWYGYSAQKDTWERMAFLP